MTVFSGTHPGTLSGFAKIVSHDLAYARIQNAGDENVCEISFRRSFSGNQRLITMDADRIGVSPFSRAFSLFKYTEARASARRV
jgi:hypothetical protein